ncbi:Mov34/MPN/PAD-1 family protein [Pedococcus sp. P5_B7]
MEHLRPSPAPRLPAVQSFLSGTRASLHIPALVLSHVQYAAWRTWPYETGGVLLGHANEGGATVTVAVGPGPDAQHSRYGFTPDADWQATQVAEAWNVDGKIEYLGDWHTHPGGTTRFSDLDRRAAVTISEAPAARQPRPVMLVLALKRNGHTNLAAAYLVGGSLRTANVFVEGRT